MGGKTTIYRLRIGQPDYRDWDNTTGMFIDRKAVR